MPDYYEVNGKYTICWCGSGDNKIYVAWYQKQSIGYFKNGTNEEKLEAAKQACREYHHQIKKAG